VGCVLYKNKRYKAIRTRMHGNLLLKKRKQHATPIEIIEGCNNELEYGIKQTRSGRDY
jgi:hypothetical protein